MKSFDVRHPDYADLNEGQQNLRKALSSGFKESIAKEGKEADAFRVEFITYFTNTASLIEKIEMTEEYKSNGIPLEEMIHVFANGLERNGTWNGEFEARIVAQHLQRPIVILNIDYSHSAIAGGQFMETKDPIVVQHTGNHYNALIYAP